MQNNLNAGNNYGSITTGNPSAQKGAYVSRQAKDMCDECKQWPKLTTPQGRKHDFCSKTCAQKNLKRRSNMINTTGLQLSMCMGCGMYPRALSAGGVPYTHCSKSCARKLPLSYSAMPFTQSSQNRNPQRAYQSVSAPASAQPQGYTGYNPFKLFTRSGGGTGPSSPTRILFYDKNKPYYGFTNFSNHPIKFEGHIYPTSEHLFQSFKFQGYRPDLARHIRKYSDSPRVAFEEAQRLKPFYRPDWKQVNIEKMDITLWHKFTQHDALKDELLSTGNAELIEDSPYDSFWGVGKDGKGQNQLGKALVRLRRLLRGW